MESMLVETAVASSYKPSSSTALWLKTKLKTKLIVEGVVEASISLASPLYLENNFGTYRDRRCTWRRRRVVRERRTPFVLVAWQSSSRAQEGEK